MDERLSLPSWLTYGGRFTHISDHPPAVGLILCTQFGVSERVSRDVWNRFFLFLFGFGSVFEKLKDSVRNEYGSVWFEQMRFSSDITVTYYLLNS